MKDTVHDRDRSAAFHLRDLFGDIGVDEFIVEYFDRKPMHICGARERFERLGTVSELRELILHGVPWRYRRLPEVYLHGKLVRQQEILDEYLDMDGRIVQAPRLERIRRLIDAGATISCFGMEAHFRELARIQRFLGQTFGAEAASLLFYSQKHVRGLAPHYDCVEIFVLQISGEKRWTLSSQRAENPVVGIGDSLDHDPFLPVAQIDPRAGDLLYIPRGTFHYAESTTEESLHASVMIRIPTFIDWMESMAKEAIKSPAMRAYAPLIGGPEYALETIATRSPAMFQDALLNCLALPGFVADLRERWNARVDRVIDGDHYATPSISHSVEAT